MEVISGVAGGGSPVSQAQSSIEPTMKLAQEVLSDPI